MATIDRHPVGTCTWVELISSDADTASEFYVGLFGWDIHRIPLGPGAWYYIFRLGGRDVAAGFTMTPDMAAGGVRPHWFTYFAVDNADEGAARATSLGGAVAKAPFDVSDVGRMAAIIDPQGAMFALWQARSNPGLGRRDEPGALCWNELMTTDAETAVGFYTGLFGLGHQTMPMPGMIYHLLVSGDRPSAGAIQITPDMGPVQPNWLSYFQAADCDAAARRVTELGGMITVGPTTAPEAGRFAIAIDPQGAHFGLLTPTAQA
jgi:predicted enzyme related to lactoylglutathione lyase